MSRAMLRRATLALALSVGLAGAAQAAGLPDYPFIHVSGSAFVWKRPDIASVDFEIVAADADPAAARAVVESRVAEVRALMQEAGLDADDAAVREVRQNVRKGEQAPGGGPVYELRCDVHLNLRKLDNWQAIANGLLGKPNVDGFNTTFEISTWDEVENDLMAQAIQDARHHADMIAAGFGTKVAAVMGVTPGGLKNLTTAMGLEREDFRVQRQDDTRPRASDSKPVLTIPVLRWRQAVDVVFRIDSAARPAKRAK